MNAMILGGVPESTGNRSEQTAPYTIDTVKRMVDGVTEDWFSGAPDHLEEVLQGVQLLPTLAGYLQGEGGQIMLVISQGTQQQRKKLKVKTKGESIYIYARKNQQEISPTKHPIAHHQLTALLTWK